VPTAWEGVKLADDGRCLLVVYVSGDGQPADRADVRWDQEQLTLALSRMRKGAGGKMAACYHCVEVPLSRAVADRSLIDGATGERATSKQSRYLDPEQLRGTERTLDSVFEPREVLAPREITELTLPPLDETERWVRTPQAWEGVRFSDDGTRLFVVYITGSPPPADGADVRWDDQRLTLTLSRMFLGDIEEAAAIYHCVEVPLSRDASGRTLVDGTTGVRASAKRSHYLDPELLRGTERTLGEVFEPRELLQPREVAA
jgi:hypothetical protein